MTADELPYRLLPYTEKVGAMRVHVQALAQQHGVTVGSHSRGGRASRARRHVDIREVRSETTYAIALHELGHVLGRRGERRLEGEAWAWAWALQHALPDAVGTVFRDEVRDCLASYHLGALRRGGGPGCPVLPDGDHVFWHLMEHGELP